MTVIDSSARARAFRYRSNGRVLTASQAEWLAAYDDATAERRASLERGGDTPRPLAATPAPAAQTPDADADDDDDDDDDDGKEPPAAARATAARAPAARAPAARAPAARAPETEREQVAAVLDAARRSMDASLAWMQRACAQFERSAQLSTQRAAQSERQLVSALASMAAREADRAERELLAPERDDDDDEPEAEATDAGEALDAQLMGSLMQRMVASKTPPKAPA